MTRAAWAAAAGMMLAAGVGCYHPAPYAPNYGSPNYPTAPPGTMPGAMPASPGGSYVVPGQSMPGSLGAPSTYPGSGPTLAPPINGGDAPPSTFEGGVNPSGDVPNYEDPNAGDFGTAPPEDGYLPPASGDGESSPFMREGTAVPRRLDEAYASRQIKENADYFAGLDDVSLDAAGGDQPRPAEVAAGSAIQPASFEQSSFGPEPRQTESTNADASSGEEDAFGYDRNSYRWLRGVVDYDPAKKDWQIIYGLSPEASDKFGGSLTLLDEGRLADFQNDDVVLVEGRIDPDAGRDVLGKPLYRVTRAELIGRFE